MVSFQKAVNDMNLNAMIAHFTPQVQLIYLVRIFAAAVMGGLVGLERSHRQKNAGIRTHIIVAMGASLVMIVSKYGFFDVLANPSIGLDPSRIASNVVTGISFLGAGVIFVRRGSTKGLTTAAGIWTTAGIGMAIGAGMYLLGALATILMLLVQLVFHGPLQRLEGNLSETFTVELRSQANAASAFVELLRSKGFDATVQSFEKKANAQVLRVEVFGTSQPSGDQMLAFCEADPNVLAFKN